MRDAAGRPIRSLVQASEVQSARLCRCRVFRIVALPPGWLHHDHMSTMIQIRNVPEDVHRAAKARAATEGLTLAEAKARVPALLERRTAGSD